MIFQDLDIKRGWPGCVIAEPFVVVRSLPYTRGQVRQHETWYRVCTCVRVYFVRLKSWRTTMYSSILPSVPYMQCLPESEVHRAWLRLVPPLCDALLYREYNVPATQRVSVFLETGVCSHRRVHVRIRSFDTGSR